MLITHCFSYFAVTIVLHNVFISQCANFLNEFGIVKKLFLMIYLIYVVTNVSTTTVLLKCNVASAHE